MELLLIVVGLLLLLYTFLRPVDSTGGRKA
jgi:hypothetical protein